MNLAANQRRQLARMRRALGSLGAGATPARDSYPSDLAEQLGLRAWLHLVLTNGSAAQALEILEDRGDRQVVLAGAASPSNPHPPNKHIVAGRLADIALVETYGIEPGQEVFAPIYDSHRVEGDKIMVTFKHAGNGLKTDDGEAPNWWART